MVTKKSILAALGWLFVAIPICYASGYASGGGTFNGGTITSPLIIATTADNQVPLTITGPVTVTAHLQDWSGIYGSGVTYVDNAGIYHGLGLVLSPGGSITLNTGGILFFSNGGYISMPNVGSGVHLASGANGLVGSGTLVAGTATIANTAIDANDIVSLTCTDAVATAISENKGARVAGTSFDVKGAGTNFDYIIQKVD